MKIKDYLDDAINLELNLSKLYVLFSSVCDNDYIFWYNLAIEEGGHASILKNIKSAIDFINYDFNITPKELKELKETNNYIKTLLKRRNISREEAIKIAINIESTAGEIHYQKLIDTDIEDNIINTFIKLNKEDEYHLERIIDYAHSHNIKYED